MGFLPQHIVDEIDAQREGTAPEQTKPRHGEEIFTGEATDYPREWAGFIGQREAVEMLQVKIAAAKARGARLAHTELAAGQHGIGKTTLAHLIAYHMEVGLVATTGKGLTAEAFRALVMPMSDRDVIFVDEAHMLFEASKNKADWLLPWMLGGGLKTNRGVEQTPDVTLVFATTEPDKAPATLRSRFMCTPDLGAYTAEEGTLLVCNLAQRLQVDLDSTYWPDVARASNNNPRAIRKILLQILDLAHAFPEAHPNLDKALRYAGVTADGLTMIARNVLILLATKPNRTASAETLALELGEPGQLRMHEQLLYQRGLIEITPQGRRLTTTGSRRAIQAFEEVS